MLGIGKLGITLFALAYVATTPQSGSSGESKTAKWLTVREAETLVRHALTSATVHPPEFGLVEVNAPDVRRLMAGQLFRMTGNWPGYSAAPESLLIINRKLYPLCIGLGGYGLTSYCVADLNHDGVPELIYTYSWGSGIHRARLAAVSKSWKYTPVEFDTSFANRDWVVRKTDAGAVELHVGRIVRWNPGKPGADLNYPVGKTLGTLRLKSASGKPVLTVGYIATLPEEIRRDLSFSKAQRPKG